MLDSLRACNVSNKKLCMEILQQDLWKESATVLSIDSAPCSSSHANGMHCAVIAITWLGTGSHATLSLTYVGLGFHFSCLYSMWAVLALLLVNLS